MKEQLERLKKVTDYIESVESDLLGDDKLGKAHYYIKEAYELLKDFTEPPNTQPWIDAPESCPLYTDYKKSCVALKEREAELRRTT